MPERVIVQLSFPKGDDDPGRTTFGYYVVEDGILTMTDGEGTPVRKPHNGDFYRHKLRPDDNPRAIAGVLTREIRLAAHGGMEGFNRPLTYRNFGIV